MSINVSKIVPMGNINEVGGDESIGTQGCSFCVAITVVDQENSKRCAHFCVSMQDTPKNRSVIGARAFQILEQFFQSPDETLRVGVASLNYKAGRFDSTNAIIEAIKARFGPKIEDIKTADGVGAHADGRIFWVTSFDTQLVGPQPAPENHLADI